MMSIFRLIIPYWKRLNALLLLLVAGAGCSPEGSGKLARVGVNAWVGYDPLVLAMESGELARAGWRLVESPSNLDSARGLRNGTLDAAALTLDETLSLIQQGVDVTIVMVISISNGADAAVSSVPWEALPVEERKLKVAVEKSSLGQLMLRRLVDFKGLDSDQLEITYIAAEGHEAAYLTEKFDVVISYEPFVSRLKSVGAEVVFDSSDMADEILDVLVVRDRFLASKEKKVSDLLLSWDSGVHQIMNLDPETTDWLSRGVGLSADVYKNVFNEIEFLDLERSYRWMGKDAEQFQKVLDNILQILDMQKSDQAFSEVDSIVNLTPLEWVLEVIKNKSTVSLQQTGIK